MGAARGEQHGFLRGLLSEESWEETGILLPCTRDTLLNQEYRVRVLLSLTKEHLLVQGVEIALDYMNCDKGLHLRNYVNMPHYFV